MSRLFWVGVGAVGGVYSYRKGEKALAAVREQGVIGTVQIAAGTALNAVVAVRTTKAQGRQPGLRLGGFRIVRAEEPTTPHRPAAIMDSGVIDITDAMAARSHAQRRRKAR